MNDVPAHIIDRHKVYLIEQVMKDAGENPQEHKSASAQKSSRTQ